jgi:RecF/RecN/SMC N terminal domain
VRSSTAPLTWLEICGFRSYVSPQRFDFDGALTVIDGANSQGKTSTAEAIEFLLTGTTVRRQLLGGAKAEFAECLRNAHIASNAPVWVRAGLVGSDGVEHTVERVLEADYTAENDCQTRLTIDGTVADDLSSIGIVLADPPLRAPVLLQHSLRFALSARPQDRADYFKSVVEVQDLETLRDVIKGRVEALRPPTSDLVTRLRALVVVSELAPALGDVEAKMATRADVEAKLAEAVDIALSSMGVTTVATDSVSDRVERLKGALEAAREGDFPVGAYEVAAPPTAPNAYDFAALRAYNEIASATDAETQRLRKLFEDVLALPAVAEAGDDTVDCPVCETSDALTPQRIAILRERMAADSGVSTVGGRAEVELTDLASELTALRVAVAHSVPPIAGLGHQELDTHASLVQKLLGSSAAHDDAFAELRPLVETARAANDAIDALDAQLGRAKKALSDTQPIDVDALVAATTAVATAIAQLAAARTTYTEKSGILLDAIRVEVDRRLGTEGWRQLAELASNPAGLHEALLDQRAYSRVRREAEHAVTSIDKAKAKVFDEKFTAMSGEIETWWNLLRPDEPARFASVRRRGTGRRFVSFKAHLYPSDGAAAVERDALGVFSDSQLNALSLAAFLARCRLQGAPVVVLDDPLQAGDDEHRPTFGDYVLGKLLEEDVQVIVLTHDDRTSKLIQHLYERLPVVGFALALEKPIEGTTVTRTSNTAEALLQRAKVYLDSDDTQLRGSAASKLREAAERIAKEIIVNSRNARGDTCSITDYDGTTLGPLIRQITPYLTKGDEPGKWRVIGNWLNPGSHDDTPPAKNELKMAFGYLSEFVKDYLRPRRVPVTT